MVDILLATYNGAAYLRQQIDSLFAQTEQNFQILARDDGSTDETQDILAEYERSAPERFFVIRDGQPTGSAKGNFFHLLKHASADHIMFCDQDDIWLPDKIKLTLLTMQVAQDDLGTTIPMLLHSDLTVIGEDGQVIAPSMFAMQKLHPERLFLNQLLPQNNVTGCTMLINRPLANMVRQSEGALMHDWWIALAAAAFGRIIVAPNRIHYRQHQSNEVGAKDVKSASYVKGKLANTGGIRTSIANTYAQAEAFLHAYADILTDDQQELIRAYVGLRERGMLARMRTLRKYKLYKSGTYRKVGQIIYG